MYAYDSTFLFDIKSILKNTPNKNLSVTLKKHPIKGNSIYATKPIKKGERIAYYKMKVFTNADYKKYTKQELRDMCDKLKIPYPENALAKDLRELLEPIDITLKGKPYNTPYKETYRFTLLNKNGREYSKVVGDLYEGSLPPPKNNVPYWGYFSNEPSESEMSNADIDVMTTKNFTRKDRTCLKEGDTVTYVVRASRAIQPGDEILWCYGDNYGRQYKLGNCL